MKAQFRSMETIVIIIVITILFIMGYAIYSNINTAQLERKNVLFEESRQARLNNVILSLDEFKCSILDIEDISCIDKFKAEAFFEIQNQTIYEEILGNSVIQVQITIPIQENITVYNNSPTNFTRENSLFTPVNVYDPATDKMSFAILKTTFYE